MIPDTPEIQADEAHRANPENKIDKDQIHVLNFIFYPSQYVIIFWQGNAIPYCLVVPPIQYEPCIVDI